MRDLVETLKKEFRDKDYRHGYTDEFLNSSIATQIKVLRDQRGWTQQELANKCGMQQEGISRLENVGYASWSISSLRRLAEAFDLTLKVTFESFGTRLADIDNFNREALQRTSFDDDPVFKEEERELAIFLAPAYGMMEPVNGNTDISQRFPVGTTVSSITSIVSAMEA